MIHLVHTRDHNVIQSLQSPLGCQGQQLMRRKKFRLKF